MLVYQFYKTTVKLINILIGGVMVSVPTSSAIDHEFELRSDQAKDYKIGTCICCNIYRLLYGIFHITCHINPRPPY